MSHVQRFAVASATVIALTCGSSAQVTPVYTFTTIDVPGASATYAYGINDLGFVSGWANGPNGPEGFVRAADGTFTTFTAPGGGTITAYGINDSDLVVGPCCSGAYILSADGTSFTTFAVPGGSATAYGINTAGAVVGYGDFDGVGFLRSADGTSFTSIDDGSRTVALGINNNNQIVGYDAGQYAFLRNADGTFMNFNFPATDSTVATGINDSGEIVGFYGNGDNDGFVRLPDGTMFTLDDPLATNVDQISAINDAGDLAGLYQDPSGMYHGFIATPVAVPESPTFALFVFAFAALVLIRKRTPAFARLLSSTVVIGGLMGCTASGPRFADMNISPVAPAGARLFVFRESGIVRAAEIPSVKVDDREIGSLARGGFLFTDVTPGPHTVLVKAFLDYGSTAQFSVGPNETVYIQVLNGSPGLLPALLSQSLKGDDAPKDISVHNSGGFQLRFVAPESAANALAGAHLSQ
jgi:hypothetical protein